MIVGGLGLVFYALGFPLFIFATIRRIELRQTFDHQPQVAAYGSLYDK
jgi:hypothetical protein